MVLDIRAGSLWLRFLWILSEAQSAACVGFFIGLHVVVVHRFFRTKRGIEVGSLRNIGACWYYGPADIQRLAAWCHCKGAPLRVSIMDLNDRLFTRLDKRRSRSCLWLA